MKKKETLNYFVAFFCTNARLQKRPNLRHMYKFFQRRKRKENPFGYFAKKITRSKIIFL
jgi:hypothetical protein